MTCDLCAQGFVRSYGDHFRISERGVARVGPCTAPDAAGPVAQEFPFRERLEAWKQRVRALGKEIRS